MRILITGATGLVGSELTKLLLQNDISIHYLTLSEKERKEHDKPNCIGFHWNPEQGMIDENALIGVDAIIHLAGATISKRWTNKQKQAIIESRTMSSNVLFKALKDYPNQVKQIVSASAIGIYPDSHSVVYTEDSTAVDSGFLAHVVVKWEESVDKFKLLHIKVCKLRTATVFAKEGGALPVMAKPIKMGFGAAFGNGKQIQSWIHIHDLARLYFFAVKEGWEGVYNAATPNPISNETMTELIAKILDKPIWLPNIPRFMMKLLLGEMHELLFNDKNVSPQKAVNAGFNFDFPDPELALRNTLQ